MNMLDKILKGTNDNMEDNKNAYSEVIEILKLVDDEKRLEALPMEMLELLKSKANPEYKPIISKKIPLDEQNLQPETYAILNWITQKYWEDAVENSEANQFDNIESIETNEQNNVEESNNQEEIQESISVNSENLVSTEIEKNIETAESETSNLPVLFDDLKWYEKIKIKIIELFNRIFKRNKAKENQEGSII